MESGLGKLLTAFRVDMLRAGIVTHIHRLPSKKLGRGPSVSPDKCAALINPPLSLPRNNDVSNAIWGNKVRRTIDRALRQGDFAPAASTAGATHSASPPSSSPSSMMPPPSEPLTVWAYNQLIRRLGKADRLSDAFEVLDGMARLGVENNHETLEFATNAAVKEVEFETRAVSMKTLPSGERVKAREGEGCFQRKGARGRGGYKGVLFLFGRVGVWSVLACFVLFSLARAPEGTGRARRSSLTHRTAFTVWLGLVGG